MTQHSLTTKLLSLTTASAAAVVVATRQMTEEEQACWEDEVAACSTEVVCEWQEVLGAEEPALNLQQ